MVDDWENVWLWCALSLSFIPASKSAPLGLQNISV